MTAHHAGVVIPAFNESANLHRVLSVVLAADWFFQIVVVDDGSSDDTLAIAHRHAQKDQRVLVVSLPHNRGKAGALLAGVRTLNTDLVVFLDADLVGLHPSHLILLCEPLFTCSTDMAVAVFHNGEVLTDTAHVLAPDLSGQRCLSCREARQVLESLAHTGYGVEARLTFHARQHGWRVQYVNWEQVTHVMKEEKRGWLAGLRGRWQMYAQILEALASEVRDTCTK